MEFVLSQFVEIVFLLLAFGAFITACIMSKGEIVSGKKWRQNKR